MIMTAEEKAENRRLAKFAGIVVERFSAIDSTQCAHAYVELNRWKWPGILADLKPEYWDTMPIGEKHPHPFMRILMNIIKAKTSEFERSRQWWRERLKRTDKEHLEWWNRKRLRQKTEP